MLSLYLRAVVEYIVSYIKVDNVSILSLSLCKRWC